MNPILLKYTEDFKVSRPIFPLKISESGGNVRIAKPAGTNAYVPTPIADDVISEIVCKSYQENFHPARGHFYIDREQIAKSAMNKIRSDICTFLDKNLPMRNPKQSKLYRWAYRNMPTDTEFNTGLIYVYRYIRKYTAPNGLRIAQEYKEHLDNAIALIDAMRLKYE